MKTHNLPKYPRYASLLLVVLALMLTFKTAESKTLTNTPNILENIQVNKNSTWHTVQITTTTKPIFSIFRLNSPTRLIIDLANCQLANFQGPLNIENGLINQIAIQQFAAETKPLCRITINLETEDIVYDAEATTNQLNLKINYLVKEPLSTPPSPPMAKELKSPANPAVKTAVYHLSEIVKKPQAILLKTTNQDDYEVLYLNHPPRLAIDLLQTKSLLKKASFKLSLATVTHIRSSTYPDKVRVVFDLKSLTPEPKISKVATGLLITFNDAVAAKESKEEPKELPIITDHNQTQAKGYVKEALALSHEVQSSTRLSKRRISIDLKDADIINVLRLLADVSGENIITNDDVKGKINLRLRNVPWDRALDTILKTKGYDKVKQNNILRIAPSEVLQKEREIELAKRKTEEQVEETQIKLIPVNYATASEIVDQIKPILSPRGKAQPHERTNTLIVEDVLSNIDRLVELTRKLDKQTPQVLIEARIVEAQSSALYELGIQWGGQGQMSHKQGNPTGLQFPAEAFMMGGSTDTQTNGVGTPANFAVNLPAAVGQGNGGAIGFLFGSAGGTQMLSLRLSALEENGNGRIVSSPRITTIDNKTARISQGIQIPVSTVSAAGTNTKMIAALLTLEVTPHVTNDGSVLMKVTTKKDEADFSNRGAQGDPTILNKSAETEVLVKDGDTTVIGGIYTRNTSENFKGVPFFSKIPLLGWFFSKRSTQDNRAELLVFITPRIVNRQEALGGGLDTNLGN